MLSADSLGRPQGCTLQPMLHKFDIHVQGVQELPPRHHAVFWVNFSQVQSSSLKVLNGTAVGSCLSMFREGDSIFRLLHDLPEKIKKRQQ